jgi:hypothetical protein
MKKTCEHINFDNERDCENEAEYMCMCCSSPVCSEHKERDCPFGGMGYIEL